MTAGPYSIGNDHCPGLSKLIEEAGEVQQVAGKIIGYGGFGKHWDGSDLKERLSEEMADVMAACHFVAMMNGLDRNEIEKRTLKKMNQFCQWHAEQQKLGRNIDDDDARAIARAHGNDGYNVDGMKR